LTTLTIGANASCALARAYDDSYPREACGFLLGHRQDHLMIATEVAVARESATASDTFEISDRELERLTAYAEDRRLRIIALFHSHPTGSAALSPGDRAALRHSEWPWLIVTRAGEARAIELACYACNDGKRIAVTTEGELTTWIGAGAD
jgi:proteasome lid subunit RPN8/RPN11